MTEFIILLSKCDAKLKRKKEGIKYYRFHFKGFYNGEKVEQVQLLCSDEVNFIPDEDYLLKVKYENIINRVLFVNHVKSKKVI